MHHLSESDFKQLRERFEDKMSWGKDTLDIHMLPSLEILLGRKNVAPVWSCEGHEGGVSLTSNRIQKYIVIAVNSEGLSDIEAIWKRVELLSPAEYHVFKTNIYATRLLWPFKGGHPRLYSCFNIEMRILFQDDALALAHKVWDSLFQDLN